MATKEIRQRRYNAVYNAWADSKVASQARFWSEERIEKELGVKVPKSIPKRKTHSNQRKKTLQTQFEKFRVLVLTETPEVAYRKSRGLKPKAKAKKKKRSSIAERKKRMKQWKNWSESKSYPSTIIKKAREVNREVLSSEPTFKRLTRHNQIDMIKNHSFGWSVLYNSYIWNEDYKMWQEMLSVEDIKNEIYTYMRRKRK